MTLPAASFPFDARPLTEPVDRAAVRAFVADQRRAQPRSANVTAWVVGIIIGVFVFFGVGMSIVSAAVSALAGSSGASALPAVFLVLILAVIGVIFLVSRSTSGVRSYRLSRFAAANNMTYEGAIASPQLPGMIFGLGDSRAASDRIRGTQPRFVEFGNYVYTTGSGKNRTTHRWGYVAVRLDVPLPNIVLDALGNNSFLGTNLPAAFRKDQRLSLEGDFDRHFALYCPEGYAQDALYLFTPDIMARFIDHAAELDAEIVDDWLFLYTRRPVSTLDPATWAWLFGVVGALLTKFDQWARWRDERLPAAPQAIPVQGTHRALPFAAPAGLLRPPPGVAQQGRRLRRSVRWVPILVAALLAAFFFSSRLLG